MQVGIFYIFVIASLNDYVIVASIIVIAIRNSTNCAALIEHAFIFHLIKTLPGDIDRQLR